MRTRGRQLLPTGGLCSLVEEKTYLSAGGQFDLFDMLVRFALVRSTRR